MVWQKLANANSVQQETNKMFINIITNRIRFSGMQEEQTYVHVVQMFAHFDYKFSFDMQDLVFKMNSFLPNDISVLKF